jgi:hypothetical protein
MAEINEIAIARIESKLDAIMDKLDRLEKSSDQQWAKIARLETDLARLQERQGPKVHWVSWITGIVALAAFCIALLDRIFTNTP